jgi:hypothetical protein
MPSGPGVRKTNSTVAVAAEPATGGLLIQKPDFTAADGVSKACTTRIPFLRR